MTHQELDRDQVVAKLFELKSRHKTAQHFAISKETLNRRLKEWGVETDFRPRAVPNFATFSVGEPVIWEPRTARQGFFGHPLGKAAVDCIVTSGPSKSNTYYVETIKPVFGKTKTKHAVIGHALRKVPTNEQNV